VSSARLPEQIEQLVREGATGLNPPQCRRRHGMAHTQRKDTHEHADHARAITGFNMASHSVQSHNHLSTACHDPKQDECVKPCERLACVLKLIQDINSRPYSPFPGSDWKWSPSGQSSRDCQYPFPKAAATSLAVESMQMAVHECICN